MMIALLLLQFAVVAIPATAGTSVRVDCVGLSKPACDAAKAAIARSPYTGPIRPANKPMACARVISYGPKPVVWVDRTGLTDRTWRKGRVIADTGVVYHEKFLLDQRLVVTESCIPRRLLRGVRALTLCTGLYEDGFHWKVHRNSLRNFQKSGHSGFYHPFLTDQDRNRFSSNQIRQAYKARYGF